MGFSSLLRVAVERTPFLESILKAWKGLSGKEERPISLPLPELMFHGPLFHSILLLGGLGVERDGWTYCTADAGAPPPASPNLQGVYDPCNFLSPKLASLLSQHPLAKSLFRGLWECCMEPFNPLPLSLSYTSHYIQQMAGLPRVATTKKDSEKHTGEGAAGEGSSSSSNNNKNRKALVYDLNPEAATFFPNHDGAVLPSSVVPTILPSRTLAPRPYHIATPIELEQHTATTTTLPSGAGHTAALPIERFRTLVAWTVAQRTVSIIKADTGSGKSTQVPQYIWAQAPGKVTGFGGPQPKVLEGALPIPPSIWGPSAANIFVTQPRRIAAVSVAKRVAHEMGESLPGIVGYKIGQEANTSKKTRITFVTTGWMLAWLVGTNLDAGKAEEEEEEGGRRGGGGEEVDPDGACDPDVGTSGNAATHILLDEVHERTMDTDMVLLVLKLCITRGLVLRAKYLKAAAAAAASLAGGGPEAASDCCLETVREASIHSAKLYAGRTRCLLMSATIDTGEFFFLPLPPVLPSSYIIRGRLSLCVPHHSFIFAHASLASHALHSNHPTHFSPTSTSASA